MTPSPSPPFSSSGHRLRRIRAAAGAARLLAAVVAILVAAGVLGPALPTGALTAWWPHTGKAFTPRTAPARHADACALVVGPGKTYCRREHHTPPSPTTPAPVRACAPWISAAAIAVLAVLARRRCGSGGRRRAR